MGEANVKTCKLTAILVESEPKDCISVGHRFYRVEIEGDSTLGEAMLPSTVARGFAEPGSAREVLKRTL